MVQPRYALEEAEFMPGSEKKPEAKPKAAFGKA
jgi:hypothetical protein